MHYWLNSEQGPTLAVVYADATSATLPTEDEQLATAAQANVTATGGRLVDERRITVHGRTALEQRITSPERTWVFRTFIVGRRAYQVGVRGTDIQVGAAHALVFLDSFEAH